VKGKNWRRGETSSYSPCKYTRSAVRAVRYFVTSVFRDTALQFISTNATYEDPSKLVQHPMLRSIDTFQMLLRTSTLQTASVNYTTILFKPEFRLYNTCDRQVTICTVESPCITALCTLLDFNKSIVQLCNIIYVKSLN